MKAPSWPIVIAAIVTATFLAVVAFIIFTLGHRMELVAPDYYAQSLKYQTNIDSLRRTQALDPIPTLNITGSHLLLAMPQHGGATGTVYLYRPSDARMDQYIPLQLDEQGHQTIDISSITPGLWRIYATWAHSNLEYRLEAQELLQREP